MDAKLKEFLDNGEYLPDFIKGFHDQKTLFKRLDRIVQAREDDKYTKDIDWMAGQVYTVDVFLWFMAKHGYTLQKSRKQVPFHDIQEDLDGFERENREEEYSFINQMQQMIKEKGIE